MSAINITAVSGLTIALQLYQDGVAIGSPFTAIEVGVTGEYIADVPGGTPYGIYQVLATTGADKLGADTLYWDGTKEITPILYERLHRIEGLESTKPMTVTPTARDAGDIHLVISGDGITSSTVTA